MATFKTTKQKYPKQYEEGKVYYAPLNPIVKDICAQNHEVFFENFPMTMFATESQKKYLDQRKTWAWGKCFLPATFVKAIIENTELKDCIEHYAIITHDCDSAPKHTHFLIKFYRNECYISKLVEYFHCDNVSNPQYKLRNCWKYLTHDTKECKKQGKFVYSTDLVITDNFEFWDSLPNQEEDNTPLSLIEDILAGKTYRQLLEIYGRDYVIYREKYEDLANRIYHQEHPIREERYFVDKARELVYDEKGNVVDVLIKSKIVED